MPACRLRNMLHGAQGRFYTSPEDHTLVDCLRGRVPRAALHDHACTVRAGRCSVPPWPMGRLPHRHKRPVALLPIMGGGMGAALAQILPAANPGFRLG
jgi:hypothetical protein